MTDFKYEQGRHLGARLLLNKVKTNYLVSNFTFLLFVSMAEIFSLP